ncbi:MAG TPA: potassium transporter KefA [Ruminococcaceae bacterium]|nr:potassium transporter KefA [Oscillospiraceae bacterium]
MNYKFMFKTLGSIFLIEALFLLPSSLLSIYDGDYGVTRAFVITIILLVCAGAILKAVSVKSRREYYSREGILLVALSWLSAAAFGALPFFISGEIPNYISAFFETVSGFTTTGASILTDVEAMSRGLLLWRSFTHWLGGMGILVFLIAVIPAAKGSGGSLYVLRAESPGPAVSKIASKTRNHAAIMYGIYVAMSLICLIFLLAGGMPVFDSFCIMFGTAGTGGFGILADSMASYSVYLQVVVTVFMALFGINFNIYYFLLIKKVKQIFKDEECRTYIILMLASSLVIAVNVMNQFESFGAALHHASFSVSSVMTTTGYSTVDFNLWPQLSRSLLLVLMLFGASAGSTGGGIKIVRLLILIKSGFREAKRMLHPKSVIHLRLNGQPVEENLIRGVHIFAFVYMSIMVLSFLIISLDNFSFETNLSAVISCMSNIGPGLGDVGPAGSFAGYSALSKIVLSTDMLLGRLEIFPMLLLFHPRAWNRAV